LFSFKFRSSFAPRRVASCPYLYNAWQVLRAVGGITVRVEIRCGKRCGFDMRFLQKTHFFRFFGLGFDLPTSWRGRFRYPLYYGYTTFGEFAPLFGFVYKCGYLRALTIYVWSEHSLWDFVVLAVVVFVVSSSFLFPFYWLLVGVFRKGF
jgi:hypothetical protein